MIDCTLVQAETLHELIGKTCRALQLQAHYRGALAYPIRPGLRQAAEIGTWQIFESDDSEQGDAQTLSPEADGYFSLSVAAEPPADSQQSWLVAVDGEKLTLHVFAVSDAGRSLLAPFMSEIGAQ